VAWWSKRGWLSADPAANRDRRREHPDRTRALTRRQVESLWRRPDFALREKTLWRLLYESAARANEILGLDIVDLDLPSKRARVRSKGSATEWVLWQTGTAQLLPRLLAGRAVGPVFLADRLPTRAAPALHRRPPILLVEQRSDRS
jgi:integrase